MALDIVMNVEQGWCKMLKNNRHSPCCFDCEFRKLPLKDTPCDRGIVEKGGLVLQCLGWRERKSNESRN